MIYVNYVLLAEFAVLAIGWTIAGDWKQAMYWVGAILCTSYATFK